jgi:iron-sulfur cluster repair protein YtfE (RIC family)
MAELAHLEADTMRHVHVENHELLPRFIPAA